VRLDLTTTGRATVVPTFAKNRKGGPPATKFSRAALSPWILLAITFLRFCCLLHMSPMI
jgi:hypothetical protein